MKNRTINILKRISHFMMLFVGVLIAVVILGCTFKNHMLFVGTRHILYDLKVFLKNYGNYCILLSMVLTIAILLTHKIYGIRHKIFGWFYRLTQERKAGTVLIVLVGCSLVIVYGGYMIGQKYLLFTDAVMDTICQFYPMYVHIVNAIKEGNLTLWNFTWGLGCDTLTRQEWLMDPFAFVVITSGVVFGYSILKYMLIVVQIMKIMVCVFLCYKFLGFFHVSYKARVLGAYLYGFNGFLMLWGQHYYFGAACMYMMLMLVMVEYCMKKHTTKGYIGISVTVALALIYSGYFGYMILLFSSVYTLLRIVYVRDHIGMKRFMRELFPMVISVFIGIIMSGVMLLPFAELTLKVSTRLSSDTSLLERMGRYLFGLFDKDYYLALLARMISNSSMGIRGLDQKYYEYPQLSFSMLNIVMLMQFIWFWLSEKTIIKKKVIRSIIVILVIFALTNPVVSSMFNAFGLPVSRWTFVLMPIFAIAYVLVWDEVIKKRKINIPILVVSLAIVYGAMWWGYSYHRIEYRYVNDMILSMNIVVVLLLIVLQTRKNRSMQCMLACIMLIIVASACLEGYLCNNLREVYDKETDVVTDDLHGQDTMEALKYLSGQDDSFYRVDKNYFDFSNTGDSLIQEYYPTIMYCSTMSQQLQDYYKYIHIENVELYNKAEFHIGVNLREELALVNAKYIIMDEPVDYDFLQLYYQKDGIYAYRNTAAGSLGILYNQTITKSQFESFGASTRNKLLGKYMVVNDEYSKYAASNIEIIEEINATFNNQSSVFTEINSSRITGEVDSEQDGLLFLSIPYRDGWNVYIDGEKTDFINANYGFIAVELTEGQHHVEIVYKNTVYAVGLMVSAMGVVLQVIWGLWLSRKRRAWYTFSNSCDTI